MPKVSEKNTDLAELTKMAKSYGVDKNALFLSTLDVYLVQKEAINKIKLAMEEDDITTTKEYVKGRENVYLHPAIKELPKHADSLNKTASQMLDLIKTLGSRNDEVDKLMDFIK